MNSETKLIETRRDLEALHGKEVQGSIEKIWPKLSHADRFVRYSARVALEHQSVVEWQEKALEEESLILSHISSIIVLFVASTRPLVSIKLLK